MDDCTVFSDAGLALLMRYVNGGLSREERARMVHHLAECARCREEIAWLYTVKEVMNAGMTAEVPVTVVRSAFDLLPQEAGALHSADSIGNTAPGNPLIPGMAENIPVPPDQSELDKILTSGSATLPFDLLAYAFNTIRDTFTVARMANVLALAHGA
jgi:hypothetical protein